MALYDTPDMKKNLLFLVFTICCCAGLYAQQATLDIMFYNLYRFPENPPYKREQILKEVLNYYMPDLLMVCELTSEYGADQILSACFDEKSYGRADFVPVQSPTDDLLQQMVFYNRNKLILTSQETYPTTVRDINRYTFVLHTENIAGDSVFLHVFVAHFKSSEGVANEQLRLGMADTFVRALSNLPVNGHVLFAGDFNFYSEDEPAYQRITGEDNPIIMTDPAETPGNWHDNEAFSHVHTQATRTSARGFGIGGATGGLDDRFDFIFMSADMRQGDILRYVPGSYKAMGNNGNCLNQRIDAYDCSGNYDLELRQHLHQMSDHTPVIMQLASEKLRFTGMGRISSGKTMRWISRNYDTDYVEVECRLYGEEAVLQVYNYMGKCFMHKKVNKASRSVRFDVRILPPGMYFLSLQLADGSREVLKFIRR